MHNYIPIIYKNFYITNLKFIINSYMNKFMVNILNDSESTKEILLLHADLINTIDKYYQKIESNNGEEHKKRII